MKLLQKWQKGYMVLINITNYPSVQLQHFYDKYQCIIYQSIGEPKLGDNQI